MPSMSMPSLSAPSLGMPSLGKMKMPKKKTFRDDYYIVYAHINDKSSWKKSGKTFTFTLDAANLYYEGGETEEKKKYKFEWKAPSDEQADSWEATIKGNCNGMKAL